MQKIRQKDMEIAFKQAVSISTHGQPSEPAQTTKLDEFWKWHKPQYWSDSQWKIFSSDPRYPTLYFAYHGCTVTDAMRLTSTNSTTPTGTHQRPIPQHNTPISKEPPSDKTRNEIYAAINAAENVLSEATTYKEDLSVDTKESNLTDMDDNVSLHNMQPPYQSSSPFIPSRKDVRTTFNMVSKFFIRNTY